MSEAIYEGRDLYAQEPGRGRNFINLAGILNVLTLFSKKSVSMTLIVYCSKMKNGQGSYKPISIINLLPCLNLKRCRCKILLRVEVNIYLLLGLKYYLIKASIVFFLYN